jgi:hypothetical protein
MNKKSQMNKKVVQKIYFYFLGGIRPGSASGCFKKATQRAKPPMLDIPFKVFR